MEFFQTILFLTTFLCSLVAGFLFAFAIVVMPGIKNLDDRNFIRAFQVMDRVIQDGHPLFMLVWIGSIMALLASVVLGIGQLDGLGRLLLIFAALDYLLGVQLPTRLINIPLNNRLQVLDVDLMNEPEKKQARDLFEPRWTLWNSIRTTLASMASVLFMGLLFRL